MTLIDLGDLRDEPTSPPAHRRPTAAGRPLRAALAALLALVVLGGSAPAAARSTVTVPARSGSQAYLLDGRLLVADPPDVAGADRHLTLYALPDTRRLWRVAVPGFDRRLEFWPVADRDGLLVLSAAADATAGETVALDVATGRTRWRQPGHALPTADGGLLLETTSREGTVTVRGVEPHSGRAIWSTSVAQEGLHHRGAERGVDRLVLTTVSGDVEVRDPRTGTVLAAGNIRPGELPGYYRAQPVGDLLLVMRFGRAELAAYGLDRLDRRWSVPLGTVDYVDACGELLCALNQTGGTWALDPATGRTRWESSQWSVVRTFGDRLLATPARTPTLEKYVVLDAATGRLVAELGTWGGIYEQESDGAPVGLRPGRDGRVTVAELDVASGRTRVLDVLSDIATDCQLRGRVLLCRRFDGGFGLWWLDR